jgi:cytochrome P450
MCAFVSTAFVDVKALGVSLWAAATAFVCVRYFLRPLHSPRLQPPRATLSAADGWFLPFVMQHAYEMTFRETLPILGDMVRWSANRVVLYRFLYFHRHVVSHQLDAEHILLSHPERYEKGPGYRILKMVLGEGLVTQFDEDSHARHRRIVGPAFSPQALRTISNITNTRHCQAMIDEIRQCVDNPSTRGVLAVQDLINRTTLNVIAEAAFHADDPKAVEDIGRLFNMIQDESSDAFIVLNAPLPGVEHLPFGPPARVRQTLKQVLPHIAAVQAKVLPGEVTDGSGKALIDYLLSSKNLSDIELRDHSVTFMFAGHETTSNSLQWMLALLATRREIQNKLFEELCEVMGKGKSVDIDTLRQCQYLNNVVKESLRVLPTAPLIAKSLLVDDVLPYSKTVVPKGETVVISIYHIHRNKHIYGDDAEEFRPERWEDADLERRCGSCGYIPFSVGKRNCIGKDFALNELCVLLGTIVRNFSFAFAEGETFPKHKLHVTLRLQSGYKLEFAHR